MPTQQQSRIDLAELKGLIVKKIGADRAQRYFSCLNGLLSQRLGKAEFDKLCYLILGHENLVLHNLLIQSILKNACYGRVPPPIPKRFSKSAKVLGKRSPSKGDGCQPMGATSPSQTPHSALPLGSNGDILLSCLHKVKCGIHDQRHRDVQSEDFGLNGKADFVSHQLRTDEEAILVKNVAENGNLYTCALPRAMQRCQRLSEQPASNWDVSPRSPNKRPRINSSPNEQIPMHSEAPGEAIIIEDSRDVKQNNSSSSNRISLQAPLGIPFFSASMGGIHKASPVVSSSSSSITSVIDTGQLSDTETLRKRMEQIAGEAGLDGVSLDCADLLNNGLDMYLKRLIRSCIELSGERSGHKLIKHSLQKPQLLGKLFNGVTPGYQMYLESSDGSNCPISFMDFKVAMELNPLQLGEDWPLMIEKISLHVYEE